MLWGRALLLAGVVGLLVVPGASHDDGDMCDELPKLEHVHEALAPPGVFEHDTPALSDVLVERRQLLAAVAQQADGELRDLIDVQLETQADVDTGWLDGWEEERVELDDPRDDGRSWFDKAVGDEADVETNSYFAARVHDRLVVECRAPELAGGPPVDTSEAPPPGTVLFFRADESSETGDLVRIGSDGDDEQALAAPDDAIGDLEALPSGTGGVIVGLHHGDEYRMIVADRFGRELDSLQRAAGQLVCPAWNDRADKVVALANTAEIDQRKLHLLDLTGETPSRPLDLPFDAVGCGDFLDDDRLIVSDAALDPGDDRGVWTVGIDGSDPEEIYRAEGCATGVGSVAPDSRRVALALTCADPLASGVWVLDLASGDAEQVAVGPAARPKWSADGEWLVFGFRPVAAGGGISIWMARADGGQLRQLADDGGTWASFPVWLPD